VTRSALLVIALLALSLPAHAHDEGGVPAAPPAKTSHEVGDVIVPPPPTYKANDVTIVEKLGTRVPMNARFKRQDGNVVTLGQVVAAERPGGAGATGGDELPTILTFNYSDCPMLCNLQLNGLTDALPKLTERKDGTKLFLGEHYRIVTIDLEPNDNLEKLNRMRERYLARFPESQREAARAGWTFLSAENPGDSASIRRVADSVGFSYTYLEDRAEYAHPAALIFLSSRGMVTRYINGIEYEPDALRDSILKAGASEPATSIGFLNRCYHFDPSANDHSKAGVMVLRIGAAGFVILLLSGFGLLHITRRGKGGPALEKGNRS
jgi:protein SCO1/2